MSDADVSQPFAEAADGVLTPAAKTPGLRATGDVAMTNATYAASVITTAVRVFRVVPAGQVPEGSDKSGSSWANATDDIDAALKDAAR